jgi:hypothetical protein
MKQLQYLPPQTKSFVNLLKKKYKKIAFAAILGSMQGAIATDSCIPSGMLRNLNNEPFIYLSHLA